MNLSMIIRIEQILMKPQFTKMIKKQAIHLKTPNKKRIKKIHLIHSNYVHNQYKKRTLFIRENLHGDYSRHDFFPTHHLPHPAQFWPTSTFRRKLYLWVLKRARNPAVKPAGFVRVGVFVDLGARVCMSSYSRSSFSAICFRFSFIFCRFYVLSSEPGDRLPVCLSDLSICNCDRTE